MQSINITIKPDENIWFTSDLHFFHENIIKFCGRPYYSIEDMNESLIKNWNDTVGKDDKVFVLGDFVLRRGKTETTKIINQLNGDIYLVPGNHDKVEAYAGCDKNRFHVCSDITYLRLRPENKDDERFKHSEYILVLSHFPQLCYSHSEKNNAYNLFGHIHSRYNMPMSDYGTPLRLRIGKQFDVGTDRNNYAPVNIFDVMRQIKEYEFWNLHNNI